MLKGAVDGAARNQMNPHIISLLVLGVPLLYFSWIALRLGKQLAFWRIEWIKLEHDLARNQGREPRNIEVFERDAKKK